MKRSSPYFILFLVLCFSCSRGRDRDSLFSLLEKKTIGESKDTQRTIANISGQNCLKDAFTVNTLKAEIKEEEKKFSSGQKVIGKWKHIDLSKISIPQANFFNSFGDKIGDLNDPNAFDYSACLDVPCVINQIYKKENGVAGYVHYLWYLKMGNLLGASNNVYGSKSQTRPGIYNGKEFEVASYLFSENELYGFWRLLKMMREPHTSLSKFIGIYRVPRGESFDFEVEERSKGIASFGETCGMAYSLGYVVLQDLCLTIDPNTDRGSFYESVLHEFTHQLDYDQGRKIRKPYRSSEQDYLDVSKFYLREFKDETGKTIRQWEHKEGIKLVSSYAGTSPAENFAETIAFFRTDGSQTKESISADHWRFVSEKYFGQKSFEDEVLMKEWILANEGNLSQKVLLSVEKCTKNTSSRPSSYFKASDILYPVSGALLNCLGASGEEISEELVSKIKVTSPDGCKSLNLPQAKGTWKKLISPEISKLIVRYLTEFESDKSYFAKVQKFIEKLSDKKLASEAYLACGDLQKEASCYEENVEKEVLNELAPLHLEESHTQDLAALYLSAHPFDETKQYMNEYYRSFVSSKRSLIDEKALSLWQACHEVTFGDDAPPSGKLFTLSEGYLISSIYNCLNLSFVESAKSLVTLMTNSEVKNLHPKEESILYDEVSSHLQRSLFDIYSRNRESEKKSIDNFISADNGKLRSELIRDFNWVSDILGPSVIQRDCQSQALKLISLQVRYDLKRNVFAHYVRAMCLNISETREFIQWLDQSKAAFSEKSQKSAEAKLLALASERAAQCLAQFPVDTNLNRSKFKTQREACLQDTWPAMEESVMKELLSDPLVIKLNIDLKNIRANLISNRRKLQLKVIKENF